MKALLLMLALTVTHHVLAQTFVWGVRISHPRRSYGVDLPTQQSPIHLAEMQVWSTSGVNCAAGGVATMSSEYPYANYPATNLIDGSFETFMHTCMDCDDPFPYVQVMFASPCDVARVDVHLRRDCCAVQDVGDDIVMLSAPPSSPVWSGTMTDVSWNTGFPVWTWTSSCLAFFRTLARADLVGIPLSSAPLTTASEGACRFSCCTAPGCSGYSFALTELRFANTASCFLYANISGTAPSSGYASGLRAGVALPNPPSSASPAGTPLPVGGWPQRGGSVTPTMTGTSVPSAAIMPSPTPAAQIQGLISTIAGNGVATFSGDGGQATSASLSYPYCVAVSPLSSAIVVVADRNNNCIRHVNLSSGIISTIAGNTARAYSGDGGPATLASINSPVGVAIAPTGEVVIADSGNNCIRLVNLAGVISTIAGNGARGFGGDGGQATSASLYDPYGVTATSVGTFIIADSNNNRVRMVDRSGIISTIAGTGVASFDGDGGLATSASLNYPRHVAMAPTGAVVIADCLNQRIRSVSSLGVISTIAGNGDTGLSGDGGPATLASFHNPQGVAVSSTGVVFVADSDNHRIRMISLEGIMSTIAGTVSGFSGDGGLATLASLNMPQGVAVTSTDAVVITEVFNHRIRLVPMFSPTPLASPSPSSTPYCASSLFRTLSRMDLVGTLVGTALSPGSRVLLPSESSCRQACCDAPACDGYSYAASDLGVAGATSVSCFLYVNITQLIPSSGYVSGIYESTL